MTGPPTTASQLYEAVKELDLQRLHVEELEARLNREEATLREAWKTLRSQWSAEFPHAVGLEVPRVLPQEVNEWERIRRRLSYHGVSSSSSSSSSFTGDGSFPRRRSGNAASSTGRLPSLELAAFHRSPSFCVDRSASTIARRLAMTSSATSTLEDSAAAAADKKPALLVRSGSAASEGRVVADKNGASTAEDDPITREYYRLAIRDGLRRLEASLPRKPKAALRYSLGNAAFRLAPKERLRYKQEYESFKLRGTWIGFALSLSNLLWLDSVWLDKLTQFLFLYVYATATLREHILWINGSRIHAWWFWHHYLSIVLMSVLLIWPTSTSILMMSSTTSNDDDGYAQFRHQFLWFSVYVCMVQMLQFRYQMARLYTLRALSKAHVMDVSTDTAAIPSQRSLFLLLPFLLTGQIFQLYNAYTLYGLVSLHSPEVTLVSLLSNWHALACSLLFLTLGLGNLVATAWTFRRKLCPPKNPKERH